MTAAGRPGPELPPFDSSRYWDRFAADFDNEPDHGLREPSVRAAWTALFQPWLPPQAAMILDAGCGTGSLSLLLAELGHRVTGIDFSPAMLALAKAKAASAHVRTGFSVMDAGNPGLAPGQFDLVVCRHMLWALPAPRQNLERWADLLRPQGRLLLVEGYWGEGGLHAGQARALLPPALKLLSFQNLSDRAELWGHSVDDERYLLVAGLDSPR